MKIISHISLGLVVASLIACSPSNIKQSDQHLQPVAKPKGKPLSVIQEVPMPAPPNQTKKQDVFTVVVNNVPVKELLFAIARDANVEIDINGEIEGYVTLNAIDQTFEQIIERVSQQAKVRYKVQHGVYVVEMDSPFLKHYPINYVNMERSSESVIAISTEVSSTGSNGSETAGNISSTNISNNSSHRFWATLTRNIRSILSENASNIGEDEATEGVSNDTTEGGGSEDASTETSTVPEESEEGAVTNVIASPESSMISVMATQAQHRIVEKYIDMTVEGVQRQVFIEATIVEVELNDDYQAGVDWSRLVQAGKNGFSFTQALTGANLATAPVSTLTFSDVGNKYNVNATVKLLNQFGNTKVLSSPKIMALNNQTALLKVVDNIVYFSITVEPAVVDNGVVVSQATFETDVLTVPVGLVMSVTPQISPDDEIILNVRPTISRISRFVADPNPSLGNIENLIPEISVREIESILRVKNGDVAVIGGLMQDNRSKSTAGVPFLSRVKGIGDLFSYRDDKASKSELVIFLKPIITKQPNLDGGFASYKRFLEGAPKPIDSGAQH